MNEWEEYDCQHCGAVLKTPITPACCHVCGSENTLTSKASSEVINWDLTKQLLSTTLEAREEHGYRDIEIFTVLRDVANTYFRRHVSQKLGGDVF